jgi:hypothetical protein
VVQSVQIVGHFYYGVTRQKTWIFSNTAVSTADLGLCFYACNSCVYLFISCCGVELVCFDYKFIIIIIIITTISFMQGIYTYIPETNPVPKQHNVAAILPLLFMVPISLVPVLTLMYFYINIFCSMCAVPTMAVFCSSLTS